MFSKSFGYAVRAVLYITLQQTRKRNVQAEEIASVIGVPRHFVSKILKRLVKEKVLSSVKGPSGGFACNASTATTSLSRLFEITGDIAVFETCALRFNKCNSDSPCPIHFKIEKIRNELESFLSKNTIAGLTISDKKKLMKGISVVKPINAIKEQV